MKIRKGFVSNSSSSSFVCDICGNAESGYDASARDVGFLSCENGHSYCESHFEVDIGMKDRLVARLKKDAAELGIDEEMINDFITAWDEEQPTSEEAILELLENVTDSFEDLRYEGLAEMCPICSLQVITEEAIVSYIDKFVIKKVEVEAAIRSKVSTYEELCALVRK